MRAFLTVVMILLGSWAFAQENANVADSETVYAVDSDFYGITYVYANGRANRFCNNNDSDFMCFQPIKDAAKRDAVMDARQDCEARQQGRLQEFSGSCNYNCNPPFLQRGRPGSTMVSCNANCSFQCDVR